MNRRTDSRMALLIDAAINAESSHGYTSAADELTVQGVPLNIITRVLTRPEERRSYPPLIPKLISTES